MIVFLIISIVFFAERLDGINSSCNIQNIIEYVRIKAIDTSMLHAQSVYVHKSCIPDLGLDKTRTKIFILAIVQVNADDMRVFPYNARLMIENTKRKRRKETRDRTNFCCVRKNIRAKNYIAFIALNDHMLLN